MSVKFFKLIDTSKRGDWLVLLAGAVFPLAFAPFEFSLLAIVSLIILLTSWLQLSPRHAAWRGFLFGIGMFGVGTSWIIISMTRYGDMSVVLSFLMTLLFVCTLAVFPALTGYAAARFKKSFGEIICLSLVWPALWVLMEWLRSWIFTGFPWLLVGYTQLDYPLQGLATWLGVYGISFAVLMSAGLLLLAIKYGHSSGWRYLVITVALWVTAWGLGQVEWTKPKGEPMTVSLIQGNVKQSVKWEPEQIYPTVALYTELSRVNWDSDLILWPETAMPIFYHQAETLLEDFIKEADENNSAVITGIPVWEKASQRFYNSVARLGDSENIYHKQHLVPFGEYVPLKAVLGALLGFFDVPMSDFSDGDSVPVSLSIAGQLIAPSICYEIIFPEEIIQLLPEANLLVNVSNDAWFGDSLAPHQHLQMTRMRALETGRWILRATNTGITALIDDGGNIQSQAPRFKTAVLTGEVQSRSGATPYVRFGNWPVLILIGGILLLVVLLARREEQ